MRRTIAGVAGLAMVALAISGCSTEGDAHEGHTSPSAEATSTASSDTSAAASSDTSSDAVAGAKVIEINVSGDQITPNGDRVEVAVGQEIELKVTADGAGEIHVHSDPEHEFEYEAGTQAFHLTIDRPGVVTVESHTLDKTIVQLEVR